jgi:hypothetical protein
MTEAADVDLFWLPLGAGGHSVRLNGLAFEAVAALVARRERRALYHSALVVTVPEGRHVIEQAPAWSGGGERGVVAGGAVGARPLGRLRLFRYEVRRWRDGAIPDMAEAVESPRRVSDDPGCARRVLELVPQAPTPVWGRDELGAGEMWNSNSLISWLLARSGIDVEAIPLPAGGRAPGWSAGIVVAQRADAGPGRAGAASVDTAPASRP